MKTILNVNINTLYAYFGALPLPIVTFLVVLGLIWPSTQAQGIHIILSLSLIFWSWGLLGLFIILKRELPQPVRFGFALHAVWRGKIATTPARRGRSAVIVGIILMVFFWIIGGILCVIAFTLT